MVANTFARPLAGVAIATATLLLVPAIAMQFTLEVSWGPADFVSAAGLLFATGAAGVFVARRVSSKSRRWIAMVGIAGVAALIWAGLAVGLFDVDAATVVEAAGQARE